MKIFSIGLSRTGTTSLNTALNMLGYRSIHWPLDDQILTDICIGNFRWNLLEQYDALTDIHGAAFYREFDKEYPGSKFILTVRDEISWMNSIQKHFERLNLQKHIDAFVKGQKIDSKIKMALIMILIVWGQLHLDQGNMLYRYQKHAQEVMNYFSDRKDLLIMNITAGEGWNKLCHFLEKPIPNVPFPKENTS